MTINGPGSIPAYFSPIGPAAGHPPIGAPGGPQEAPSSAHVAAPKGTNPELWHLLTTAEQSFFAEQAALGPITYGPPQASPAAVDAPRGQRIDVRA